MIRVKILLCLFFFRYDKIRIRLGKFIDNGTNKVQSINILLSR